MPYQPGHPSPYGPPPVPRPKRHWTVAPHDVPQPYLHLLRTRSYRWWKGLLGLPLAIVTYIGLSAGLVVVVLIGMIVVNGPEQGMRDLEGLTDTSSRPGALLFTNIALALFVPSVWAAVAAVHTERIGWLSSVARRIRWRLVLGFGLLATVIGLLTLGFSFVIPAADEGTGGVVPGIGTVVGMFFVVSLTTPLQAAAEEYAFRGYLSQVVAAWIPRRAAAAVVATLVSATLFALAHGAQDPWLFADRFAFGLTASAVVLLTGGLEASIAYHAVNNIFSFALATLTGSLDAQQATAAPATLVIIDIAGMALYVGATLWWTRRRPPQRLSATDDGPPIEAVAGANPAKASLGAAVAGPLERAVLAADPEWHAAWRRPDPELGSVVPAQADPASNPDPAPPATAGASDLGGHPGVG
jgi:membrane protease YdiL (CAAX protease family)